MSLDPSSDRRANTDPSSDRRAKYDYRNETVPERIPLDRPTATLEALSSLVDGDVRFDEYTRQLYATDASAYAVTPIGVVYPTSTEDVAAVVEHCADHAIPVLPRGGGTSLAGQTVNEAVVLDFTRYMDDVLEVDPDAGLARAQTGVTLGDLDRALEPHGLKFAPDPSTAERSALGGAIGNNTTGAHSLQYGKTDAYLEQLEVVLADGSVHTLGEIAIEELRSAADPDGERIERIYAEVLRIVDEEADAIEAAYPDLKRNVSGYNLDVLLEEAATGTVNLARLLVGSEGTLAIATEATVSLEPIPETKSVAVLTYPGLLEAMDDVGAILEHDPAALEVMDDVLLDLARETAEFGDVVAQLPDGTDSFLLVEFYADSDRDGRAKVEGLIDDRVGERAFDALEAHEAADRDRLWKMRKASTPILLSRTGPEKHIAFIEDLAVPPEHLSEYVADFQAILSDHETFGSFYAHAGPGCLHVRPLIHTGSLEGIETMVSIADDATDLAVKYGGSVSGEHGDGRARTQWNRKLYGDDVFELFGGLKSAFDPDWLLNPGPVCGEVSMAEHLRFDLADEFDAGFEPTLQWDNEDGFDGMVQLCHGCGGCRTTQDDGGVMCPTYRASHEEITSTRGRANLLRRAMTGELPDEEVFSEAFVDEVLDLCIGCKGCSRDCPSEVDMAKLKAELEHAYHERNGVDRRSRLFANVDRLVALGSRTAPISNWLANAPGSGVLAEKLLGIARERSLPTFHRESLVDWFDARGGSRVSASNADRRALLFPDSYTNYTNPDAGRAAIRVLEALGVHVAIPEGVTGSGRPPYSKGFLDVARDRAAANVEALSPRIEDGWDVVLVEPSDAVMIQTDYGHLLSDEDAGTAGDVSTVAANTYGIMEYVDVVTAGPDGVPLSDRADVGGSPERLIYHGHCHQKATTKDHHTAAVLRQAGYEVDVLDSGCCGMAGSFGYEAEHYSMSRAIGRILFEQIDERDGGTVVAPGASCRTQIGDEYDEKPPHPVEKLADVLP